MNNISTIHDCYGCGVCAMTCAKQIISIKLNGDGFYEPYITDESKCTNCGLCLDVCAYSHDELSLQERSIKSYAGWSEDSAVRRKCSSGGVGFELGRTLISEGYKVCGVRYNAEKNRAEHYIATTVEELIPSIGSKYIQSYTVEGFKAIDKKQRYLVTGTPCQMDSFRRYLRKSNKEENFVLMDFFCHGVPSKLMWDKYVAWVEKRVGRLTYVSWRNKFTGWHDSWAMAIDGEIHGEPVDWKESYNLLIRGKKTFLNSRLSQGDMFYRLFLSDCCLGKACYERCKFKYDRSSADIRIGDAWGSRYAEDQDGVSVAISFTSKGDGWLRRCGCQLTALPLSIAAEGQMREAPKQGYVYRSVIRALRDERKTIAEIYALMQRSNRIAAWLERLKHPVRSFKGLIRRIWRK